VNTAENAEESVFKVLAHEALGFTLFAHGKFAAAHAALERSISMSEDSKAAAYLDLSAQDPRVHVRLYDGIVLWLLGYPDQALRICAEARRYAETSQHPFSEALARQIRLRVPRSCVVAPEQALRSCAEARRYAETSQHPFSEALARTISHRVHQLRGEAVVVA